MKLSEAQKLEYKKLRASPLLFVKKMWGLEVQPVKQEYSEKLAEISSLTGSEWEYRKNEIKAEWFGDFDEHSNKWIWLDFQPGKHLTWQQWLILKCVEKAVSHTAAKSISIRSGRGIGKSATLSMTILWYLFCNMNAIVPCTAPTSDQMYDVLWKELALWIHRMPKAIKELYDWESSHIRIKEKPYTWFARAKTASKENPEALSGVHAPHILGVVDEASAVTDEIFEMSHGIFSSENAFMIMISNPTRLNGYFYDSHNKNRQNFQCLAFSSLESPIVHADMVVKYSDEGFASDKFRVNVQGEFPKEDSIDDQGYVPLLLESSIRMIPYPPETYKNPMLGIDPSGEGDDITAYALRDNFVAQIVGTETNSTPKTIGAYTLTLMDRYRVQPSNVVIDAFGTGAEVSKEIALASRKNVRGVNVGEKCENARDNEMFLNKRAKMYWDLKIWLERGGMIVQNEKLKEELLSIKFRRNLLGRIEIMSKRDMRKKSNGRIPSPNLADALALTFIKKPAPTLSEREREYAGEVEDFDPYSVF